MTNIELPYSGETVKCVPFKGRVAQNLFKILTRNEGLTPEEIQADPAKGLEAMDEYREALDKRIEENADVELLDLYVPDLKVIRAHYHEQVTGTADFLVDSETSQG